MTTVSNVFAHLPNGIISEIVSYTGTTYKKRNGKYMGQIPKNDPRYAIIETVPKMRITFFHTLHDGSQLLCYEVNLTHPYDKYRYF
jgi:hypothetical protein